MIRPLHRDQAIESAEKNRIRHISGRALKRLFPFVHYTGPPPTRRSVVAQLKERDDNTFDEWRSFHDCDWVNAVLEIFRDELSLPNCRFVPDDPLATILQSGIDSDVEHLFLAFHEKFGVRYSNAEIESAIKGHKTLGEFMACDLASRLCQEE